MITRPRRRGTGPGDHREGRQRVPSARHADAGASRCRRARTRREDRYCRHKRIYVCAALVDVARGRQRPHRHAHRAGRTTTRSARPAALARHATADPEAPAHADRRPAHPRRRDRQQRLAHRWHRCRVAVLDPTQPLRARLRGRYLDAPLAFPVELAVSIIDPEALIKAAATGFADPRPHHHRARADWRMPATVSLSGPLRLGDDDLRIVPARLGMAAAFQAATTRVPFALGLHGPLRFDEATWTLAPAGIALRRRDDRDTNPVPDARCQRHARPGSQTDTPARRRARALATGLAGPALADRASRSPLPFALPTTARPVSSMPLRYGYSAIPPASTAASACRKYWRGSDRGRHPAASARRHADHAARWK